MTLRLEITSDEVHNRKFTGKDGKEYEFRDQEAWLHDGGYYPRRFLLSIGNDNPFAPGFYRLGAGSFRVSRFNALELSRRLELLPED